MPHSTATHAATLHVPHTHPSLPGHFPGQPIVPGVVLLDQVLQATQLWLGGPIRLRSLSQAKFMTPLLPDQEAQVQLKLLGTELRFTITRAEQTIAQGVMNIESGAVA